MLKATASCPTSIERAMSFVLDALMALILNSVPSGKLPSGAETLTITPSFDFFPVIGAVFHFTLAASSAFSCASSGTAFTPFSVSSTVSDPPVLSTRSSSSSVSVGFSFNSPGSASSSPDSAVSSKSSVFVSASCAGSAVSDLAAAPSS